MSIQNFVFLCKNKCGAIDQCQPILVGKNYRKTISSKLKAIKPLSVIAVEAVSVTYPIAIPAIAPVIYRLMKSALKDSMSAIAEKAVAAIRFPTNLVNVVAVKN